jgi:hypothetical protein
MARLSAIALLVVVAAACAAAQDIVDNPYPKNGDVCKDAGDQWRTIKLGTCEAGTKCQAYKRGEFGRRRARGPTAASGVARAAARCVHPLVCG